MLAQVARIGDEILHSGIPYGVITTGSLLSKSDGIFIARVGDEATCSLHGPTTIATGSPLAKDCGQPIARIGDTTACGAQIGPAGITVWSSE